MGGYWQVTLVESMKMDISASVNSLLSLIIVVDRKKNIFKISIGEYIAYVAIFYAFSLPFSPEYLENIYCRSELVAQCFVYGNSLRSQLVAVVIPDEEVVKTWAKHQHLTEVQFHVESFVLKFSCLNFSNSNKKISRQKDSTWTYLVDWFSCSLSEYKTEGCYISWYGRCAFVVRNSSAVGKTAKLNSYEFVKAIHVDHEVFSLENGILVRIDSPLIGVDSNDEVEETRMSSKISRKIRSFV